jgi:hypothetical protein
MTTTLRLFSERKSVENTIHHHTFLLDSSGSMALHRNAVPEVMDAHIKALASDSGNHPNEETRVSVFAFSSPGYGHVDYECLLYDMDVLRVPSIKGMYRISGGTALCDNMIRTLDDLEALPVKYGKHFHLLWLISDGEELHSTHQGRVNLAPMISRLPDYYTIAAFTPSVAGKHFLSRYGFPQGNISIWDPMQESAIKEVGFAMAAATTSYTSTIRSGIASKVTSLFEAKAPKVAELRRDLVPMTPGSYYFEEVTAADLAQIERGRLDQFMELKAREKDPRSTYRYVPGKCYYEFTVRARVQHYKQFAIAIRDSNRNEEDVYVGASIREKLGLPPEKDRIEVRVSPGDWSRKGYKVYVLSTSNNRKLLPGTRVLVMR